MNHSLPITVQKGQMKDKLVLQELWGRRILEMTDSLKKRINQ